MKPGSLEKLGTVLIIGGVVLGVALSSGIYQWEMVVRGEASPAAAQNEGVTPSPTPAAKEGTTPLDSSQSGGDPVAGKAVYAAKGCDTCHPAGAAGIGPAVKGSEFQKKFPTDQAIIQITRQGKGTMPAYGSSKISDKEMADMVAYIKSLSSPQPAATAATSQPSPQPTGAPPTAVPTIIAPAPTPTPKPAVPTPTTAKPAADPAAGQAVYSNKGCTACHPGGNAGVGPALKGSEFQQKYPSDDLVAQIIRQGKGGMPAYAASQVGDKDMADLIAYIRSLR